MQTDGRMDDAATDIDALQRQVADGFASLTGAIGELRGEMRAAHKAMSDGIAGERAARESDRADMLARVNAAITPLATREGVDSRLVPLESGQAELFRRANALEPVVAAHGAQIAGLQSGASAAEAARQARATQAYGRRWQWVAWVIAAIATLADLIRAVPHLFSGATR